MGGGRAGRPAGMPPATANPNMVEESYLGTDQRLKTDRHLGVVIIRWQYDRYGREIGP